MLLAAGFINGIRQLDSLTNPILVNKNGKWGDVCLLGKPVPGLSKGSFPLPRVNQAVDSTVGRKVLFFLDAHFGYHHIMMRPSDQLATSFITFFGAFCYISMPFGLRNTARLCSAACSNVQIS
jgi:hypothetical protein